METSAQTNNSGIEFDYVNALIANSGYSYKAGGTRNVAVIFISDGIPGQDGGSSTTAAANAIIDKALTAKMGEKLLNCCLKNREKLRENINGFIRWNKQKEDFEFYEPNR